VENCTGIVDQQATDLFGLAAYLRPYLLAAREPLAADCLISASLTEQRFEIRGKPELMLAGGSLAARR
jgi:hypothetical protein